MGNGEVFKLTAENEEESKDMELSRAYNFVVEKKQATEGDKKEGAVDFLQEDGELPGAVVDKINEKIADRKIQYEATANKQEKLGANKKMRKALEEDHKKILCGDVEEVIRYAFAQSWDPQFKISTHKYLMNMLIDEVDARIDKNKSPEELNKTVVIFFDIDGLKSVNDNVGHDAGDKYLQRVCDFFYDCNTVKWLEQQGIEVEPSHRSGDEFIVSLSAKSDISISGNFEGINGETINDVPLAEYAMKEFEKDLHSLDMNNIQNFNDQSLRDAYKDDLLEDKIIMPKDFQYRASMSGGWASLADAMRELKLKSGEIKNMSFNKIKKKIVNKAFALSDTRMETNKINNKKDRANSKDLNERILQIIYDANRAKQRADD
ncbi:diguanylate cyclase [bacterium]|nr:diguanylate cyclase [bacterium]